MALLEETTVAPTIIKAIPIRKLPKFFIKRFIRGLSGDVTNPVIPEISFDIINIIPAKIMRKPINLESCLFCFFSIVRWGLILSRNFLISGYRKHKVFSSIKTFLILVSLKLVMKKRKGIHIDGYETEGFSFGLTSGIITTLGLMVCLQIGTDSLLAVVGAIVTIAIGGALSDALAMHLAEESRVKFANKKLWRASIATFLSQCLFTLTFLIPVLLFRLETAIVICIVYGLILIAGLSTYIGIKRKENVLHTLLTHVLLTIFVIVISYLLGKLINFFFI